MLSRSLYYVPEDGVALQMRHGALCARAPDSTVRLFAPRVHGLRVIILAGHGASITSEAIGWCGREGVGLNVMERAGQAFAVITEAVEADGRRRALSLRQKQFKALLDPYKRLEIARKIVGAKLRTQPSPDRCPRLPARGGGSSQTRRHSDCRGPRRSRVFHALARYGNAFSGPLAKLGAGDPVTLAGVCCAAR
jgi:hypothetical protein